MRQWLGLSTEAFYDADKVCILPMGFCYPGRGRSGDLPPRKECAETWRKPFLAGLSQVQLKLLIGQYALRYHLPQATGSLTDSVSNWRHWIQRNIFVLPHPSPRNRIWLQRNPWFEEELVPVIRHRVRQVLAHTV